MSSSDEGDCSNTGMFAELRNIKDELSKTQPSGHVAYIAPIEINKIVFASEMENGYMYFSHLQHRSLRYHLSFRANQVKICFGKGKSTKNKSPCCPLCARQ